MQCNFHKFNERKKYSKLLGAYRLNIRWILWKIRVRIWRIIFGALNQSILKEISPGCSLGLMLKLKLQYFRHLIRRADSFEKTLMLGKIEGRRRRGLQRMRWLDGIMDSMDMSLGKLRECWWTGRSGVLWSMASQRVRHDWVTELNWTESTKIVCVPHAQLDVLTFVYAVK